MKGIPTPKTPIMLQKIQWILNPVEYMEKTVQNCPEIFNARVVGFGGNLLFISNPAAIQEVLTNDTKQYTAPGEFNNILEPLVGNKSLFMLEGDRHRRERKLMIPPFHGERMENYGQLIIELTHKTMQGLTFNQRFLARNVAQEISLQVILQVVFGLYEGERCDRICQLIRQISDLFRSPLASSLLFFHFLQKNLGQWSPWGYFQQLQKELDQLLYAEIDDRRHKNDKNRTDILSLLMEAKDENGEGMGNAELRDELLTLLFAGHETTATAIAWALYWTHLFPTIREKLVTEIESLGENSDPMSLVKLPYLNAVCNETLRIYPVAMLTFPRVAKEKVELLGYSIQRNTPLVGCIYLTHQREDLYPEAKKFKPERFLERQYSPYEFIPFGHGSRRCVGAALASFEMKLVLATILENYSLDLVNRKPVKPQRRGVTLAPKGGVKMIFKGKRPTIAILNHL